MAFDEKLATFRIRIFSQIFSETFLNERILRIEMEFFFRAWENCRLKWVNVTRSFHGNSNC